MNFVGRSFDVRRNRPVARNVNADAVAAHVRSLYGPASSKTLERLVAANDLAVTMRFGTDDLYGSLNDSLTYLNAFGRWFQMLMIRSFGNHLGRKRQLQPLCYAFVDYPNSRGSPALNVGECFNSGPLHVHALISLRLGQGQACRQHLLSSRAASGDERSTNIHVEAFDPSRGSLENLIAYFKKGADVIGTRYRGDAYDVFPR